MNDSLQPKRDKMFLLKQNDSFCWDKFIVVFSIKATFKS